MAFAFSLEKVLDVRRREEEAAQRKMAGAVERMARIERQLEELRGSLVDAARQRDQLAVGALSSAQLSIFGNYVEDVRTRIVTTTEGIERARAEVERCRSVLIEASRRCQALEELKKEERKEYIARELTEERRRNDEIALFGIGRSGGSAKSSGPTSLGGR